MPSVVSTFCVTETGENQFVVFPPTLPPAGPLKPPSGLFGIYEITGQLRTIHNNLPPKGSATKEQVNEWLKKLREAGCYVRPGNYKVDQVNMIAPD